MVLLFLSFNTEMNAGEMGPVPSSDFIINRGERPYMDIDSMPEGIYETGKIRIKLSRDMEHKVIDELVQADPFHGSYVVLNVPELDRLNRRFTVKEYKPILHNLYEMSPASNKYRDRHRAWGFHLWFELILDEKICIIEAVKSFSELDNVETAEPVFKIELIHPVSASNFKYGMNDNSRFTPNDTFYEDHQWSFNNTGQTIQEQTGTVGADISVEAAWDIETGWDQVIVAVFDGGIDYLHPDLNANMWPGIGPDGTGTVPCSEEHGTHVGGTVAAVTNNGIGVAGVAGGSGSGDGVRLMSIDIFPGNHGQNSLWLNTYAADNGAAISQNSWGYLSPGGYNQIDLDGIDYFNQHGGGTVLNGGLTIFAAGNSNSSANWYPAYYSGAMAVASTDNRDKKSSFSNYGSWIEISAPGTDIASTGNRNMNPYRYMSGTSMACPHVSGVAALMVSYAARNGLIMQASEVRQMLKDSADDIYGLNLGFSGQLGTGRLNAHAALLEVQELVSGVLNPQNFIADAVSTSQINLSWQKNADDNDVMVLWSLDGVFGTPDPGTAYTVGSVVPGGGTVLYRGGNTSYMHTDLSEGTMYYYRAFSYDGSNVYSSGISANTATLPSPIDDLPFEENFNASASLPSGWVIEDHQGNGQVWQFGTINNGLTGTTGNYAYLNSDGHGSGNSQNSDLITPMFDFTNYEDISLSFEHYYRHWSSSTATLSYSIDNGNTWHTIQNWTSNTSNPASFNQVIPQVAGQSQVRFKWNYTGTWGYYWCVDDVLIDGVSSGDTYNVTLFADPADIGIELIGGGSYQAGTMVNIQALTDTYTFVEWTGATADVALLDDPNSHSANFSMPSRNIVFTAVFEESHESHYTVSLLSDPPDIGVVLTGAGNYEVGEPVAISATLGKSYEFSHWSGIHVDLLDNAFSSSAGFLMPSHNVTFTAVFQEDQIVINELPFEENFNASASLPSGWVIEDHQGNEQVWQFGTISNGLTGTTGNYAYLNSDAYGQNNSQNSDLITPVFDFTNYEDISLSFQHYFRQYLSVSTATLSYSIDNGNTWHAIQTWTTSTDNPLSFSQVVPEVAGQTMVRFKWNYTGTWGYYWCVDDVLIDGVISGETYTVSLFSDPTDIGAVLTGSGDYASGSSVIISASLSKSYEFSHWSGAHAGLLDDPSSSTANFTMPSHAVSFTAVFDWTEPLYAVSLFSDPTDIGAVLTGSGDYASGSSVIISASLSKSYKFSHWSGAHAGLLDDPSSSTADFTMPSHAVSFTAVFEWTEPLYTVSLFSDPTDIGAVLTGSGDYASGSPVTISASLGKSYEFSHWSGAYAGLLDDPNSSTANFTMPSHALGFTAVFEWTEPLYTVSLFSYPSDIGAVLTGAGDYASGSPVTISASLGKSYEFSHWSGVHAGLLDDPNSATASFTMPSHTVTFMAVFMGEIDGLDSAVISLENPSVQGLWHWTYNADKSVLLDLENDKSSWTWQRLIDGMKAKKLMAEDISGDGLIEVIILTNDNTLGYYSFNTLSWNLIFNNCYDFTVARTGVDMPKQIVFSIQQGLYILNFEQYSIHRLYQVPVETIIAADLYKDGLDELVIGFYDLSNLYVYSFATGSHSVIARVKPSQMVAGDLTGDGFDELICAFEGFGIYVFKNISQKTQLSYEGLEDIGPIDLINEISEDHKWVYDAKGWAIQRITYADPMPGHKMTTGNIAFGDADELILSMINRTFYYSYSSKGWTTLVHAPMKTITTGRFTGGSKDDIIACFSSGNHIYLRNTALNSWLLMASGGNSNAMTRIK